MRDLAFYRGNPFLRFLIVSRKESST